MAHIDDAKRIHLIGIGGCSMNGLALILKSQGHEVTGSDRERTQFTDALDHEGIRYSVGHTGEYVEGADLVIYSAAIKPENPERVLARQKGIPELERSEALGQINIDDDHLDYYENIDAIVAAFERFLALLPEGGTFVACVDDPRVKALADKSDLNVVTYGLTGGDYTAANIEFDALGNAGFTVVRRGETLGRVQLSVPGMHNVINALGAIVVSDHFGVPFTVLAQALHDFHNTRRRFEFYGERNGVKVFHDYGHHPNEIRATLDAAKRVPHKKLYCVFQCNSYTRARTLFCNNVTCFTDADHVLVPDIYPGREKDTGIVHARDMVRAINKESDNAVYIPTFEEIRIYLDEHAEAGDLVVTVGSGDVYRQTKKLL